MGLAVYSFILRTSLIDNDAGDSGTVTSQQVDHRFHYDPVTRSWSHVFLTGVTTHYLQV